MISNSYPIIGEVLNCPVWILHLLITAFLILSRPPAHQTQINHAKGHYRALWKGLLVSWLHQLHQSGTHRRDIAGRFTVM